MGRARLGAGPRVTLSLEPALVWCPFPDAASAEAAAATLLDARLIACANVLPAMRSLFLWQGERGQAEEVGVLFKTGAAQLDRLLPELERIHPYACPAIVAWRCDAAAAATRAWLEAELAG